MKRKKFVLLMLVFLLTLSGCGRTPQAGSSSSAAAEEVTAEQMEETFGMPVVKVMTDLTNDDMGWKADHLHKTLMSMPGFEKDFMIYEEQIPQDGADRDNAITRVKTEIMAGKGPDIFLCENPMIARDGQGLFPFPEKAIKNHLLLPLDSYIENAEYMEWDKLLPVIMEAGRNDEGQQILPMTFNFDVRAYNKELFTLTGELPVTWDEAIASEDPMVCFSAYSGMYRDGFGVIADLEKDTMLLTEKDMVLYMEQAWELWQDARNGGFPEFTEWNEEFGLYADIGDPAVVCSIELGSDQLHFIYHNCLGGETEYWLVPKYNTEGGITVNVEAFAAINRNTEHPDESFRILDKLMSYSSQSGGLFGALYGMPTHMDVGMNGQRGPSWNMNDWNARQYQSLLGQINSVRFTTPVEQEFWEIFPDHYNNGGEWPDIVHKHYMKMQMLLAES